jgi:hypothetical protein
MFDARTLKRQIPAFVATLLVLGSAAALAPRTAGAYYANEIGQQAPALVDCYAKTDTVVVRPLVGTGTYWNAQYVGYRFWIYNERTGQKVWLSPAGTALGAYTWFLHQRVQRLPDGGFGFSGGTSETAFASAPAYTWTVYSPFAGDWQNYIYAQYAWNTTTGVVTGSPIKTTTYFSGLGNLTYCGL